MSIKLKSYKTQSGLDKIISFWLIRILLVLIILFCLINIVRQYACKKNDIVIFAGKEKSESYEFVKHINDEWNKNRKEDLNDRYLDADSPVYDLLDIEPSLGSLDNVAKILNSQKADDNINIGIIQSDTPLKSDSINLIAHLYPEFHQFIVLKSSNINSFSDLKNKTIAISDNKSGQLSSFLRLLKHYI